MLRAYVDGELVVTEDIPSTPEICLSIWLLSVCVVVYASFFLASTAVLVVRFYKLLLHRKKLQTLRDGNSRMDPKTNSVVSVAIHGKSALNS
ncbi:hypothetical protein DPMN_180834 [Dreissena polymorpha]|uniref:Uncharacterized protein n=2 Tax=Dreissena polymorpha TaxID=45954 RepID=A0A9D4I104_DREPO|nr:hypothetical protein DPMN_180834 [Dreissena polymorpha]